MNFAVSIWFKDTRLHDFTNKRKIPNIRSIQFVDVEFFGMFFKLIFWSYLSNEI